MNVQFFPFPNSWFSNQQRKVLPVSDVGAQERLNEARELVFCPNQWGLLLLLLQHGWVLLP